MKKFQLLGHTADIRLKIEADTLENLFQAGLEGMNHIIREGFKKDHEDSIEIRIQEEAKDVTDLLIQFLASVLTEMQTQKALFCKVKFHELTATKCVATLKGVYVDGFDEDIKAVTYHEAEIQKNKNGNFETMLVFDI